MCISSELRNCETNLLADAPLQPRGVVVQFRCNGTSCGLRAHWSWLSQAFHMKRPFLLLLQCNIENKHSYLDELNRGLCSTSNRLAWGALYQISYWVEGFHSFLTFTVGSLHAPPLSLSEASWLSVCTEAPSSDSGKTHCIWLALPGSTCVFCLARAAARRRTSQLPAAAPRPVWHHPPATP